MLKIPLDACSQANTFKMFLLDVGLLGAMSNLPVSILVDSRKKKSLLVYGEKFNPPQLTRTTLRNLRKDGDIVNIPLYLMHRFNDILG